MKRWVLSSLSNAHLVLVEPKMVTGTLFTDLMDLLEICNISEIKFLQVFSYKKCEHGGFQAWGVLGVFKGNLPSSSGSS